MPRPLRPLPPAPLHFVRLAQGSPGEWVALPGGTARVIQLPARLAPQAAGGWLLCLQGEAVLDLPDGDFVRLRPGEGYWLDVLWEALPTRESTVLLLLGQGSISKGSVGE